MKEGGREENGGGKEGGIRERRGEEHKDRGRETVKQRISALSHSCRWESLHRVTVAMTRKERVSTFPPLVCVHFP